MADGDIFRNGLGYYKKLYESLCEGKASIDECTRMAISALKQDLQKKGNLPIVVAQQMGERLSQVIDIAGGNNSVDWGIANREIEKILQVDGRHDVKELILCAGKSFLHELRYDNDRGLTANSISEAILGQYMTTVLESGFHGRIPLTDEHLGGMNDRTLKQLIQEIQPAVVSAIGNWANKANIDGSVTKLYQFYMKLHRMKILFRGH
ncbi:MAG: hypothetical protein EAZ96_22285 [Oscillatoriales cyanobacterium]|nr:MAG: hypothetical protein EAZ96_22285 [Oscillatoriales cyanobacterium]